MPAVRFTVTEDWNVVLLASSLQPSDALVDASRSRSTVSKVEPVVVKVNMPVEGAVQ
ncbi:hypothetical protein [Corallococcus carmarthensis]|uniref:hypothetical protein n=1 Tax=Corallococcus carmarthensis TaxID=2316728 RepID=UPI0013156BEC|nr:hypothetical protein [Corallococcus carmarthensis]NOK15634.1 hypothetical protein [Corallococcus carmarthensis]